MREFRQMLDTAIFFESFVISEQYCRLAPSYNSQTLAGHISPIHQHLDRCQIEAAPRTKWRYGDLTYPSFGELNQDERYRYQGSCGMSHLLLDAWSCNTRQDTRRDVRQD